MRFAAIACMLAGCAGNEPLEVPPLLDPPSLAENASVVRVELVQGAPVALMDQGEALPGARPIVAGRPGLLRVCLRRRNRVSDWVRVTVWVRKCDWMRECVS